MHMLTEMECIFVRLVQYIAERIATLPCSVSGYVDDINKAILFFRNTIRNVNGIGTVPGCPDAQYIMLCGKLELNY